MKKSIIEPYLIESIDTGMFILTLIVIVYGFTKIYSMYLNNDEKIGINIKIWIPVSLILIVTTLIIRCLF